MQINVSFNATNTLLETQFADNSTAMQAEFADYQTVALPGFSVEQTEEGAIITAKSGDEVTTAIVKHGRDGEDGEPITHRWDGTNLIVTSASGTSSADLKGKQGDPGKPGYTPVKGIDYFDGEPGKPGYTPVKGVDYFDGKQGDPGYTPVKGVDYFDGEPGKTPVLGTDYFTEADKAEMVAAVKAALTVETWTFTLEDGTTVTKDVCINA